VYQWCEFKSRRGKNTNLTAQKSNSNTVWFNFQTKHLDILSSVVFVRRVDRYGFCTRGIL